MWRSPTLSASAEPMELLSSAAGRNKNTPPSAPATLVVCGMNLLVHDLVYKEEIALQPWDHELSSGEREARQIDSIGYRTGVGFLCSSFVRGLQQCRACLEGDDGL